MFPKIPSAKQLKRARSLGVKNPELDSTPQLKQRIQDAVNKAAADYLRQKRIRLGTVLRKIFGPDKMGRPQIVMDISHGELNVISADASHRADSWPIVIMNDGAWVPTECEVLFNPPERFLHWFWFRRQAKSDLQSRLTETALNRLIKGFQREVSPRLAPEHKVETTYGEYWSRDAWPTVLESLR